MNISEFNPIIARKEYSAKGEYIPPWRQYMHKYVHTQKIDATECNLSNFGPYSPAYSTTNEDWRFVMHELKPNGKSVLTVTGSGDQPIAFAINGAQDIDTFDISFFSNLVMQMKTSAIQTMNLPQYKTFVNELTDAKSLYDIPMYNTIKTKCAPSVLLAIRQMHGCKIFSNGSVCEEYMPNESEYRIAQNTIKNSIGFIWTDVRNLHNHLNKSYDIMHMSNIFEHFNDMEQITQVINCLKPFMRPNGQMTLHTSWVHTQTSENIVAAASKCEWAKIESREKQNAAMLLLTRVR